MLRTTPLAGRGAEPRPSPIPLIALACGAIVANIYYAQPLIGLIAPDLHLTTGEAGLIVTLTQLGYATGLVFIASLADLIENRRLIVFCMVATVLGLLAVALSRGPVTFFLATFAVGVSAVGTQVLVPLAAHLAPEHSRGRTVGNVMGGLLAGIMLARPVSSMIAAYGGWRAPFLVATVLMAALAVALRLRLPARHPNSGLHYGRILFTMLGLLLTERVLQRRALFQALMFAAFNLFWTAIPLLLSREFGLTQRGIALFALAGAGGALAAPIAGRLADRGLTEATSAGAMATAALAWALAAWSAHAHSLAGLVVAGVALDAAVQANQVCGQRTIYALAPSLRGRLNAVYITCLFAGGAVGSALATTLYATGGFILTAGAGVGAGVMALVAFAILKGSGAQPQAPLGAAPPDPPD